MNKLLEQIAELDTRLAKGEKWLNNNLNHPKHEEFFGEFINLLEKRNELENVNIKQDKLF